MVDGVLAVSKRHLLAGCGAGVGGAKALVEAQAAHRGRVLTKVAPRANHTRAEDYHQHDFAYNPQQSYCGFVAAPKVEKFRRTETRIL